MVNSYINDSTNDIESPIRVPAISIKPFNDQFNLYMRNEITANRLDIMSNLAEKLEFPQILGKPNAIQYRQTLELFLNSTEETRRCGLFILKYLLPNLKNKGQFLDVGPGDGRLTRWISNKFKETTCVDSNKNILDNLNNAKKITRHNSQLHKIYGSITSINLPNEYFDLGLLSHVLYYVQRNNWVNVVKRVFNTIKYNGVLLIVLSGDDYGKAALLQSFGGKLFEIEKFIRDCSNALNTDCEIFTTQEEFKAKDLNTMLHIAGFLLCDANITATREELTNYLNRNAKKPDGTFVITSQQKFILFSK